MEKNATDAVKGGVFCENFDYPFDYPFLKSYAYFDRFSRKFVRENEK